ncbi:N-acetylmuramoyl-L-alanine amidase [Ferruginibacter sp.]
MLTIAYYLLKVIICSGILYGYYWLMLRNKVFHKYNRFYLMASVVLSLSLPLIKINFWEKQTEQPTAVFKVLQVVNSSDEYMDNIIVTAKSNSFDTEQLYPIAYLLVSVVLLVFFIHTLVVIFNLLKKYPRQHIDSISFINTDAKSTPFSFLNYIFWNYNIDMETTTGNQIFKHELAHVQEGHTYDKLFINIILIFFWSNPFFWLYRKELNMIHEFIADKKAVEDSDTEAFAAMILQATYPQHRFQLTNNFFYSPVKRRLLMLMKNKNPKVNYFGRIMVLPLALLIFAAFTLKSKGHAHFYNGKKITVVIDAGHGGKDGGIKAIDGTLEKDLMLSIAKEIKELNTNDAIEIILTKEDDQYLTKEQKAEFAKSHNAAIYITLHGGATATAAEKEYGLGNVIDEQRGLKLMIGHDGGTNAAQSKLFASAILTEFSSNYALPVSQQLFQRAMYTLENNSCPSVFIETGLMNDKSDLGYLQSSKGKETIAINILNAIEKFASSNQQNTAAATTAATDYFFNTLNKSSKTDSPSAGCFINVSHADTNYLKSNDYKTKALVIVDGKEMGNVGYNYVEQSNLTYSSIVIYNPYEASKLYGTKGRYGVIKLTQKDAIFLTGDSVFYNDKTKLIKLSGSSATIKGNLESTVIYVEGKKITPAELNKIDPATISSVNILKGEKLDEIAGEKGKTAVINVSLKPAPLEEVVVEGKPISVRSDLADVVVDEKVKTSQPITLSYLSKVNVDAKNNSDVLYVIDNKIQTDNFNLNSIAPNDIATINVLKDKSAIEKYGDRAKAGVIEIITKSNEQAFVTVADISNTPAVINNAPAVISVDKMNVLYIGVDNPVSIAAPGIAPQDVQLSISQGSITGGNGKYIARVVSTGEAIISLSKKGSDKVIQTFSFRVNRLPDPAEITVTGRKSANAVAGTQLPAEEQVQKTGDIKEVTVTGYQRKADPLKEVTVVGYPIFTKTEIEPEYPGGSAAWKDFMVKNLNPAVPVDEGWKAGTYTVIVQFVVHTDGAVSDVTTTNYKGSKTAQHCIDLIKKSANWIPAMQNGRKVNAYRKQPITFVIEHAGKRDVTEIYSVPLKVHLMNDGKETVYNMVGNGTFTVQPKNLYLVNGAISNDPGNIKKETITSMESYDAGSGALQFGDKGKYGVTMITTKG